MMDAEERRSGGEERLVTFEITDEDTASVRSETITKESTYSLGEEKV
jgi:hypothetical protein